VLSLDDPRWAALDTAYGKATNIPALLRRLQAFPPDIALDAEPYLSLYSALCHQSDVYTASYAASPVIVDTIANDPVHATWTALALVVDIELARLGIDGRGPPIPPDLEHDYLMGLARLRDVTAALSTRTLNDVFARVVSSALALANGFPDLAWAILELSPEVIPDFRTWITEER
jgi:hypothetical protein